MEVKTAQPTEWSYTPSAVKSGADSAASNSNSLLMDKMGTVDVTDAQQADKKDLTEKELLPMTKELNKFFQYLNADLQFELHERTQRLMVKVVDLKTDKVLREFPPHELLDKIANIRDYIGVLLDKKA